jgi:hypothetical protein
VIVRGRPFDVITTKPFDRRAMKDQKEVPGGLPEPCSIYKRDRPQTLEAKV